MLAVLEKVQPRDPLHIPHTWLVHPQERLHPLRLRLIVLHTDGSLLELSQLEFKCHVTYSFIVFHSLFLFVGSAIIAMSCIHVRNTIKEQLKSKQRTVTKALCSVGWASWDTPASLSHDLFVCTVIFICIELSQYSLFQSSFTKKHDWALI